MFAIHYLMLELVRILLGRMLLSTTLIFNGKQEGMMILGKEYC